MEILITKEKQLKVLFTGKGSKSAVQYLTEWANNHQRACFAPQPLTDNLLAKVDLMLFPAQRNQTTSMNCLKGLVNGVPVIVGQNSGLTDLVFPEYNGFIIKPDVINLVETIQGFIAYSQQQKYLSENAKKIAQYFTLDIWRNRWRHLLQRVFY